MAPGFQRRKDLNNAEYMTCVKRYSEMIFRIAFSYFGNQADAEDLMQDIFLKLLKTDQLPEPEDQRRAWLIRVTVNQCHSTFRSPFRKRKAWLTDYEWDSFADDTAVEDDVTRRHCLYNAVMSLPDKYRITIHLYYYEDLSVDQIADLLHVKATTIQTRLARAREKLKAILGEDFSE